MSPVTAGADASWSRARVTTAARVLLLVVAFVAVAGAGHVAAETTAPASEIDVSVYADPPVASLGDAVTFTVLVENTGDGVLEELTVTDGEDVEHEHAGPLAPDEIAELTTGVEVTERDVRVGTVVATFVAEAVDEHGATVRSSAVVTVEILGHPQLRGTAWAEGDDEPAQEATERGLDASTSVAIVAAVILCVSLLGGWLIGRVGRWAR